jgi:apolipoprotein N-acyltransferase
VEDPAREKFYCLSMFPYPSGRLLLAPTICYEDAFGAEQLDFLPAAGLLVNVSNDAWFGDSIAAHQHLEIARMRALETGRPMLRATNTGITALIGPDGSLRGQLPQFEPGVLKGQAQPRAGATPYVRTGNAPVVVVALGLLAFGLRYPRRAAAGA